MAQSLVIVESPAKAKTINKILGHSYKVMSSWGHVRDLPKSKLGVNVEDNFSPSYLIPTKSRKVIKELKNAVEKVKDIYLAPDPDREGEAIAWHLQEVLNAPGKKFLRVTFNEITKTAVLEAFEHSGTIDTYKVESQQARRILDRLVGYNLSPLLWVKVGRGLSAGRVQSVALKLICDREAEINRFTPEEYWTIEAELEKREEQGERFKAKLAKIGEKKPEIRDRVTSDTIIGDASGREFIVRALNEKEQLQHPAPPYITSTLQQAGVNLLRWPIVKTMKVAQQLYEGLAIGAEGTTGLITYMRTDSFRVAPAAQHEALKHIEQQYGPEFVPTKPNVYRSRKGAQEAHEAIRPTSVNHLPKDLKTHLDKDQYALYKLIWQRFVASQMASARLNKTTVEIAAGPYLFRATDTRITFPGYMKVAGVQTRKENETPLPTLREGEKLDLIALEPSQHFTKPPPPYTEATLVRELEEKGIGRPSTYAPIILTIRKRGYVSKQKGRLRPTPLGTTVTELLVQGFPELINVEFTARMEDALDSIESGKTNRVQILRDFYKPFMASVEVAKKEIKSLKKEAELTSAVCEKCGKPMVIRHSFKGEFLACSGYPRCRNIKPIKMREDGSFEIEKPVTLDENCPRCGKALMERQSRYGKFIACSGYPECRYIKPKSTGIKCPQPGCDGDIIEKKTRGRRKFYGCSNYPKCRFTAKSLESIRTG
jgi:DNA topoisomerase-1